jgi:hypothetical protein
VFLLTLLGSVDEVIEQAVTCGASAMAVRRMKARHWACFAHRWRRLVSGQSVFLPAARLCGA